LMTTLAGIAIIIVAQSKRVEWTPHLVAD